jgi:hypothetical protein
MNVTIIFMDREYFGDHFTFECVVNEGDHRDMIDAASDAFWSSDERLEYADSFASIEEREEADERYEIFATIINADGVYVE